MNAAEHDGLLWASHEYTVRRWLNLMSPQLMFRVAQDLQETRGGRWVGFPPECMMRRALLMDDVMHAWERATGRTWPLVDDTSSTGADLPDQPRSPS